MERTQADILNLLTELESKVIREGCGLKRSDTICNNW